MNRNRFGALACALVMAGCALQQGKPSAPQAQSGLRAFSSQEDLERFFADRARRRDAATRPPVANPPQPSAGAVTSPLPTAPPEPPPAPSLGTCTGPASADRAGTVMGH